MDEIIINNMPLSIKEYEGKRVVTLRDIDMCHKRPEGTARRNFNTNKEHFIEGEDFFKVCANEIRTHKIIDISPKVHEDVTLITESGYYMLVKSFTDDLSWDVQRQLVNSYFRVQQVKDTFSDLSPQLQLLIGMEIKQKQLEAKQAAQETAIANTNQRIDNMCEVISLDKNAWRKDTKHLISNIAAATGSGYDTIADVYKEVYKLVESRAGVSLQTRLTNKRNRMAGEGICKSKRDKQTKVDIIADDKKLIEIYVAIVKEMAVKYGVCK